MAFTANYVLHAEVGQKINLAPVLAKLFSGSDIWGYSFYNQANDLTQGFWGNGSAECQILLDGLPSNSDYTDDPSRLSLTVGNDVFSGIYLYASFSTPFGSSAVGFRIPIVPVVYVDATPRKTTGADVVAAAYQLLENTNETYSPNGCHTIAETIAAMAGAPLPGNSYSIVPSENVDGGFWTVVHRGDQTPVAEWTALLRPGDIVRYDYADPSQPQHTFTVLDVDGLNVQTIDNWGGTVNLHWTNYQQWANPAAVTIYRITQDMNTIALSDTADASIGSGGADRMRGLGGDDFMSAGLGRDILFGGSGLDTLDGGDGDDILRGEADNDALSAGAGRDTLFGGAGDDRIDGGSARDVLTGDAGRDIFVFQSASDTNGDRIRDFRHGVDLLDVSRFAAQSDFIGGRGFHATPGVSEIHYDRTTGQLSGDTNGDGVADWTLTLTNRPALSATDFIF